MGWADDRRAQRHVNRGRASWPRFPPYHSIAGAAKISHLYSAGVNERCGWLASTSILEIVFDPQGQANDFSLPHLSVHGRARVLLDVIIVGGTECTELVHSNASSRRQILQLSWRRNKGCSRSYVGEYEMVQSFKGGAFIGIPRDRLFFEANEFGNIHFLKETEFNEGYSISFVTSRLFFVVETLNSVSLSVAHSIS